MVIHIRKVNNICKVATDITLTLYLSFIPNIPTFPHGQVLFPIAGLFLSTYRSILWHMSHG